MICFYLYQYLLLCVVATTRRNGTCSMLTSAKLSVGYLVVGITRELDKELSLHCYLIYISYKWFMLQQYIYLMSTPQWLCKTVHSALTSMCPTCGSNVVYMLPNVIIYVINFIQLVSPQPVDRFSQSKLRWKALNEGYLHIYWMYKSNNKQPRYQAISSYKSFVC